MLYLLLLLTIIPLDIAYDHFAWYYLRLFCCILLYELLGIVCSNYRKAMLKYIVTCNVVQRGWQTAPARKSGHSSVLSLPGGKNPLEGGSPLLYTSGVYSEGKLWCTKAATFQGIQKRVTDPKKIQKWSHGECGMQVHNGQRCMSLHTLSRCMSLQT